jgi:hypothetical protein
LDLVVAEHDSVVARDAIVLDQQCAPWMVYQDMYSMLFPGFRQGCEILFDLGQRDSFYVVDAAEDYYDSWVKLHYIVVES